MGIRYDAGMDQDYSYLFQGLSGGNLGNLNMLSDYASIKNGSYGKLMKAYYGSADSSTAASSGRKAGTSDVLDQILEAKKHPTVSKEAQEANSKLTSGLSSLTNSVAVLQNEDTYKVLEDGKSVGDKTVSAVKNFVSMYNEVVKAAKDSTLSSKTAHVAGMMRSSQAYSDRLSQIGITINRDGTLQLNEGQLKAADLTKVQELFSGEDAISYGSTVMSRLGFASASAGQTDSVQADAKEEEDNATYTGAAALKADIQSLTSGSLFERITDQDGTERYDVEKILAAVKSFAGNYNSMLDSALSSLNSGVTANLSRIMEKTSQNQDALEQFGISVDKKGRLKVDGDAFRKSDLSQFQKFMEEYGSSIQTNVSLVNYYMTTQADAASGYTAGGAYYTQENSRYNGTV